MTATAIANVAVFDGARRRDGLTVVFDERVLAIGRAHEVPEVDPADTIDGTGCTLLPGLVDMHVHVLERDVLPRYLDHGVTAIKDVGNDLETILAHRRAVREGDVDGPTILLCGSMLDGPEPMWPEFSMAVADEDTAASAVDELARAGVDGIKLYVYLAPEHMRAAIARAHEHGLPVTAHLGATPASEAIALGLDGVEHDPRILDESRARVGHVGRIDDRVIGQEGVEPLGLHLGVVDRPRRAVPAEPVPGILALGERGIVSHHVSCSARA